MSKHNNESLAQRGQETSSVAIAFLVLAWFFLALRIWTRTYVIANFGWDDSTMLLAGMVFTVYCSILLFIEAHGGGTHIQDVAQLAMLTKWAIAGEVTYVATVLVLKLSLGIFFARIVVKRWQLIVIYANVTSSTVSSLASFFYCLFRCGSNLDDYVYHQMANHCTSHVLDLFFAYQHAAVATFTDCVFASLPVFILWNTNMNRRSKMSVGAILSLAALGCVCSAIRFQYIDGLTQVNDFFYSATSVTLWSNIELGAGIIAGCLATLRPILKQAFLNARSLQSSASRSLKQSSRSSKSVQHSAKHNVVIGSSGDHAQVEPHIGNPDLDGAIYHSELIEMRPRSSNKGDSTECILSV